jgi:hypothetical protein
LPGAYKVIAEQSGFEVWTGRVTAETGTTAKLAIALVEKPSQLTVRVAQPGARVTVDGAAYDATARLAAGAHQVVVSLAGFAEARPQIVARAGKPVELEIALTPLVPVRLSPASATLLLDGKPVAIANGAIAVPPGSHTIVARAPGFHDRRSEVPAERAPGYELAIELATEPAPVEPAPARPSRSRFTDQRKLALVVGGVGLGIAGGGVLLGRQSKQLEDDAHALCPPSSSSCADSVAAAAIEQHSRDRAHQANIAYAVAGGTAIVAVVLWLTGAPDRAIAVAVTPRFDTVAGLDLALRF